MTNAIRDAAIEAAARALCKLDGKIADAMLESYSPPATFPLWRQYEPAARAAIAAYERALWRPIAEAPKGVAVIVAADGVVGEASQEEEGVWVVEDAFYAPTRFRPLPAPPEDTA